MAHGLLASPKQTPQAPTWSLCDIEQTTSSNYADAKPDTLQRQTAKKRGRDWFLEREYISRQLAATVDVRQSHQTRQNCPFSSIFPALTFPSDVEPAIAEPTRSWSSEDTADYDAYEMQSSQAVPSKRFRKYCKQNPYAAQAAAASLLAGAAWLEAVQALAAVKAVASSRISRKLEEADTLSCPLSRDQES